MTDSIKLYLLLIFGCIYTNLYPSDFAGSMLNVGQDGITQYIVLTNHDPQDANVKVNFYEDDDSILGSYSTTLSQYQTDLLDLSSMINVCNLDANTSREQRGIFSPNLSNGFSPNLGSFIIVVTGISNINNFKTASWINSNGAVFYVPVKLKAETQVYEYPDTVIQSIIVGEAGDSPGPLTITPDGKYVYVSTLGHYMAVINTQDNSLVNIDLSWSSGDITASSDGKYIYLINNGSILKIDTSDNTVIDTIEVGHSPVTLTVSPNSEYIYVSNIGDSPDYNSRVSVVRTSDDTIVDTIPMEISGGILATHDGTRVYLAQYSYDTVSVISTITNTIIDTISVKGMPSRLTETPDGRYVYVTNFHDDTVSIIRTSDNTVVDTIGVGEGPYGIAITPDGKYIYVANNADSSVSVISTSENIVIDTIELGHNPYDLVVTPDGNFVYVTLSDNSVVVFEKSK